MVAARVGSLAAVRPYDGGPRRSDVAGKRRSRPRRQGALQFRSDGRSGLYARLAHDRRREPERHLSEHPCQQAGRGGRVRAGAGSADRGRRRHGARFTGRRIVQRSRCCCGGGCRIRRLPRCRQSDLQRCARLYARQCGLLCRRRRKCAGDSRGIAHGRSDPCRHHGNHPGLLWRWFCGWRGSRRRYGPDGHQCSVRRAAELEPEELSSGQ